MKQLFIHLYKNIFPLQRLSYGDLMKCCNMYVCICVYIYSMCWYVLYEYMHDTCHLTFFPHLLLLLLPLFFDPHKRQNHQNTSHKERKKEVHKKKPSTRAGIQKRAARSTSPDISAVLLLLRIKRASVVPNVHFYLRSTSLRSVACGRFSR